MRRKILYAKLDVKWENLVLRINTDGGIAGLLFEGQKHVPNIPNDAIWIDIKITNDSEDMNDIYNSINRLIAQLKAYETGELKAFDLNLSPKGTAFQELVWKVLMDIPYGEATTYGVVGKKVAEKMGRSSMSSQAVGGAVGRNPISIIVPCHRVLGADGGLTGYAGGLNKKRALLSHEGLKLEVQLSLKFE